MSHGLPGQVGLPPSCFLIVSPQGTIVSPAPRTAPVSVHAKWLLSESVTTCVLWGLIWSQPKNANLWQTCPGPIAAIFQDGEAQCKFLLLLLPR